MDTYRICAIIPAYNEARTIGSVLEQASTIGMDLLVVDDGSTDGTIDILRGAPGITLLVHEVNRGKGAAIRTAIACALDRGYDGALFLDADGQHLPQEGHRFVEEFVQSGADLIVGSRMADTAGMPSIRRFSNWFSSTIISLLAGTRVTDSQSGYRLLSAALLERLRVAGGVGFDFESEMIIDAARAGLVYREVPISCIYGDETSHYHPVKDTLQFLGLVLRKAVELMCGRRP